MNRMKKTGCIVFALVFICSVVLTGCGGSKDSTVSSSSNSQASVADSSASAESKAPELKPYELNCYFLAPQTKDLPLIQDEVSKLLTEKINATIKLNYFFWDSYQDKQKLVVASGEKIDVMFSPSWWGWSTFVAQKAWLELDDLLAQYGADITKNINPAYLKAPVINGKLYAIPTNKDMFGVGGVLVNKALAEKYNFDFSNIKTPADFEPMLKTIKEKEPGIVPFVSAQGDHASYFTQDALVHISQTEVPVGYQKTDGDIKVVNLQETPEYINVIKMTREWYNKGYINKDVATLKDSMPVKKAQKAFMWGEQLKPGKNDEMKAQLGYDLIQVNAYKDIPYYATTGDLTNSMLVIPRTSEDPARAMMFINLLFNDKQIKNLLDWGIENKHYKKIGENQIDFADGVTADNSGYTGIAQWAMGGDQFLDYLWANESPDKWTKMKEFNESAKPEKLLGWVYNPEAVKTEIATLATVGKNMGNPLNEGIVDYDKYYPKMKESLEKAGINKVCADAQKQVDDFLAAKK